MIMICKSVYIKTVFSHLCAACSGSLPGFRTAAQRYFVRFFAKAAEAVFSASVKEQQRRNKRHCCA